jgi:hypothetical protein
LNVSIWGMAKPDVVLARRLLDVSRSRPGSFATPMREWLPFLAPWLVYADYFKAIVD